MKLEEFEVFLTSQKTDLVNLTVFSENLGNAIDFVESVASMFSITNFIVIPKQFLNRIRGIE